MEILARFMCTGIPSNEGKMAITVPEGTTAGVLLDSIKVVNGFKLDRKVAEEASILVNKCGAGRDTVLKDGDEIMVIKTLGGG